MASEWTEYPMTDVARAWAVLLDEGLARLQHSMRGEHAEYDPAVDGAIVHVCDSWGPVAFPEPIIRHDEGD